MSVDWAAATHNCYGAVGSSCIHFVKISHLQLQLLIRMVFIGNVWSKSEGPSYIRSAFRRLVTRLYFIYRNRRDVSRSQ